MNRRGKQARLLTGGLVGASSGTTGRRGVGKTDTSIEYLIVGGGGGGRGGGGGAGGLLTGTISSGQINSFAITVGSGGVNANGGDSSMFGFTAIGGGVGGEATTDNAATGGSGGGGGHDMPSVTRKSGTSGQGNQGGRSNRASYGAAGGGGGAGGAGGDATSQTTEIGRGGDGGVGLQNSITGSAVFYAGGGGGGVNTNSSAATSGGTGGSGGGGDGGRGVNSAGNPGTDGLGGGGGGADYETDHNGGRGGSGVVIVRWTGGAYNQGSLDADLSFTNNLTATYSSDGDYHIATFTATTGTSAGTGTWSPKLVSHLRTRGYIGAAPAGSGMLTLYDRYVDRISAST